MENAGKGLPGPSIESQLAQDAQQLAAAVRRISADLGAAADILDRVAVAAGATMADAAAILASSPPMGVAGAVQNAVDGLPVARANAGNHKRAVAARGREDQARSLWEEGLRNVAKIAQQLGVSAAAVYGYRYRAKRAGRPWLPASNNSPKQSG